MRYTSFKRVEAPARDSRARKIDNKESPQAQRSSTLRVEWPQVSVKVLTGLCLLSIHQIPLSARLHESRLLCLHETVYNALRWLLVKVMRNDKYTPHLTYRT